MKGVETKVTIQVRPNKAEITSDDVFDMIFYRNRESRTGAKDQKHYGGIAKEIVKIAASKPEHLHDSRYEELAKNFNISVNEYLFIIKRLRLLGILRKKGHKIVAIRSFTRYTRRLSLSLQNFCDDLGIPLEEQE